MPYQTNFLKQVILRLDFAPLSALYSDKRQTFSDEIRAAFPHAKGSQLTSLMFDMGTGSPVEQKVGWQWQHSDSENDNSRRIVVLAPNFFALEYKGRGLYSDFVEFRQRFTSVYDKFGAAYRVPEYTRIGLRYINEITLDEGNALDWDGLLAADLATGVKPAFAESIRMTRSMHQVTGVKNDISCLINYGLNNPDFPNPIARRQFVFDVDSSIEGGIPESEAKRKIDSLYDVGRDVFEASIDNGLRQIMGVGHG
jgi:uncharacterized protein (TIGR04255 family)